MSAFNNPKFQARIRAALVWASEQIESEAECLKEACTSFNGEWDDSDAKQTYEFEIGKVREMAALLKEMGEVSA